LAQFSDGLYAALGGGARRRHHEYVLHWLNDFNLSLTAFAGNRERACHGGRRARADIETERAGWRRGQRMRRSVSLAALEIYRRAADELRREIDLKIRSSAL